MNLGELKKIFHSELANLYEKDEIESFFKLLMNEYLRLKPFELLINSEYIIENKKEELIFDALSQLKLEKPIQYILSKTHFYGLEFILNNNVLIPRPETEELVDWIIKEVQSIENKREDLKVSEQTKNYKQQTTIKILDIGTGSGCIAISLAKNLPNIQVYALDVSEQALTIARLNAKNNKVEIEFIAANVLELEKLPYQFDIIVSNPPYVREVEKTLMKNNVIKYEPHLALFVKNEDPLLFYKQISKLASKHLIKGGWLYFEINQYLGKETIEILKINKFTEIELKKDLYGNDRMLKCKN